MTENKKAAQVASTGTASNTAIKNPNSSTVDPLIGWFELAKPSRDRQQKKAWLRKKGGRK